MRGSSPATQGSAPGTGTSSGSARGSRLHWQRGPGGRTLVGCGLLLHSLRHGGAPEPPLKSHLLLAGLIRDADAQG